MAKTRRAPKRTRESFAEEVANQLIKALQEGTAPWQKPWEDSIVRPPVNALTGHTYGGANLVRLMLSGYSDPRWMTYKQAQKLGEQLGSDIHVRRGEKGTSIMVFRVNEAKAKAESGGQEGEQNEFSKAKGQGDGEHLAVDSKELLKPYAYISFATVFNASQIEGMPPLERQDYKWTDHERIETLLRESGADIRMGGNSAFYSPGGDFIRLPERHQFASAEHFYSTALHELGHWTGHPSRLDRDLTGAFGSEDYAREELRAEISSMMVGGSLGLRHDPSQHVAYVGSWIKVLREDPLEILRASSDAQKITDYVLDFDTWDGSQESADVRASDDVHTQQYWIRRVEDLENATDQCDEQYLDPLYSITTVEPQDDPYGGVSIVGGPYTTYGAAFKGLVDFLGEDNFREIDGESSSEIVAEFYEGKYPRMTPTDLPHLPAIPQDFMREIRRGLERGEDVSPLLVSKDERHSTDGFYWVVEEPFAGEFSKDGSYYKDAQFVITTVRPQAKSDGRTVIGGPFVTEEKAYEALVDFVGEDNVRPWEFPGYEYEEPRLSDGAVNSFWEGSYATATPTSTAEYLIQPEGSWGNLSDEFYGVPLPQTANEYSYEYETFRQELTSTLEKEVLPRVIEAASFRFSPEDVADVVVARWQEVAADRFDDQAAVVAFGSESVAADEVESHWSDDLSTDQGVEL